MVLWALAHRAFRPGRLQWVSPGESLKARDSLSSFDLNHTQGNTMSNIIYIVGAVVIILAVLGFLGLR